MVGLPYCQLGIRLWGDTARLLKEKRGVLLTPPRDSNNQVRHESWAEKRLMGMGIPTITYRFIIRGLTAFSDVLFEESFSSHSLSKALVSASCPPHLACIGRIAMQVFFVYGSRIAEPSNAPLWNES